MQWREACVPLTAVIRVSYDNSGSVRIDSDISGRGGGGEVGQEVPGVTCVVIDNLYSVALPVFSGGKHEITVGSQVVVWGSCWEEVMTTACSSSLTGDTISLFSLTGDTILLRVSPCLFDAL